MISHANIEISLYNFLRDNLETPYSYVINYGEVRFESNPHDLWLSVVFEDIGAGAKKFSSCRLDIMSRVANVAFNTDEITAIDRIRERLTNANFPLYDNSSGTMILVPNEKLIIKNSDGRFTTDRVVLDNLREEDLKQNLKRSSIFFRLELLTDTVGGRVI